MERTGTDGTILEFVNGSHSYEGVWFGEQHPDRKGMFWWRPILTEYFKEQIVDAYADGWITDSPDAEQYYSDKYEQK